MAQNPVPVFAVFLARILALYDRVLKDLSCQPEIHPAFRDVCLPLASSHSKPSIMVYGTKLCTHFASHFVLNYGETAGNKAFGGRDVAPHSACLRHGAGPEEG
jgi:hypothetical protein